MQLLMPMIRLAATRSGEGMCQMAAYTRPTNRFFASKLEMMLSALDLSWRETKR